MPRGRFSLRYLIESQGYTMNHRFTHRYEFESIWVQDLVELYNVATSEAGLKVATPRVCQ